MIEIGWFSTARGETSQKLLRVVQQGIEQREVAARISFVFSDREPGESPMTDAFFDQVRSYGIPLVCFSYQRFREQWGDQPAVRGGKLAPWRLQYDAEVMRRLEGFSPDLCLLAGYMLIFGEEMCRRYQMINLHPTAPGGPAGTWQRLIWQLIQERASSTGVMMHLVTPQLDQGPPVTYCTFSLRGEPFDRFWAELEGTSLEEVRRQQGEDYPLFQAIRRHGVARELPLMVATLKAFGEHRVRIEGGRVLTADHTAVTGIDLTQEIDTLVSSFLMGAEA